MKKCLHLKKTKRHWRRKPPKVVTWQEKARRETEERRARINARNAMASMIAAMPDDAWR